MALKQTVAPANGIEPLSLADAKLQCGVVGDQRNDRINFLIRCARRDCETATGRQFIDATWVWKLPHFPASSELAVPKPPLSSVTHVKYIDTGGSLQTLSTDVYELDTFSAPGRIALKYGQTWPGTRSDINAVTITFVAGYGDAATDVPENFVHAMQMLVGHWNQHREAVTELQQVREVPMGVERLLFPGKMITVGM